MYSSDYDWDDNKIKSCPNLNICDIKIDYNNIKAGHNTSIKNKINLACGQTSNCSKISCNDCPSPCTGCYGKGCDGCTCKNCPHGYKGCSGPSCTGCIPDCPQGCTLCPLPYCTGCYGPGCDGCDCKNCPTGSTDCFGKDCKGCIHPSQPATCPSVCTKCPNGCTGCYGTDSSCKGCICTDCPKGCNGCSGTDCTECICPPTPPPPPISTPPKKKTMWAEIFVAIGGGVGSLSLTILYIVCGIIIFLMVIRKK